MFITLHYVYNIALLCLSSTLPCFPRKISNLRLLSNCYKYFINKLSTAQTMLSIHNFDHAGSAFNAVVTIQFDSGLKSTFNLMYLLDNCTSPECQHPETKQRTIDIFNGDDIKVNRGFEEANKVVQHLFDNTKLEVKNNKLICHWFSGHHSEFPREWLISHSYAPKLYTQRSLLPETACWDTNRFAEIADHGHKYTYGQLAETLPQFLREVYTYGFGFVNDVPVSLEATREVSEMISIIRPTHYDLGVWDFTSDLAKNDTAYTSLAIDMHTDGNYWNEPPGLQLFHLLEHSGGQGGETRIVDVAKIVEILVNLSKSDAAWKTAYEVLTTQPISFHQAGEKGACYTQNNKCILSVSKTGQLQQCRWNNSDRSPQFPTPTLFPVGKIYEALFRFNCLINDPKNYVQFQLTPGKILVFDNCRVLHARNSFTGYRRLCGSYLTRDDFLARLRGIINDRNAILDAL
ncbi:LANO_0G15632g1_1 [Lachancea nothofagi CBS 11611]|uniref:LANO_0G15632g1_1 n=1 Tax=Lachancea nothofagi CBS 11611 TaxID=1266666 RepID=A0A1G4KKN6_9SACH|nr:LANO_0G15632g1_1 [Lachancea nothofagi CBS 11611]